MLTGVWESFLGHYKSWWEQAGVREEAPVVKECWMGAGGLWELSGCVSWVRGGREEGVPGPGCASTVQGGGTGQD